MSLLEEIFPQKTNSDRYWPILSGVTLKEEKAVEVNSAEENLRN